MDRRREAERWVAARRHVIIGFFRGHDLKERMSRPGWRSRRGAAGRGASGISAAFRVHRSRPVPLETVATGRGENPERNGSGAEERKKRGRIQSQKK